MVNVHTDFTSDESQAKARATLLKTIRKIRDSNPMLGMKWKSQMLSYYYGCLAELTLLQRGDSNPSAEDIATVKAELVELGG